MAPKELVVVVPNAVAQMEAVNFLLSTVHRLLIVNKVALICY